MSHQLNGITKRENKHYKRSFKKIQNPPMEGICEVIHYGLRLMITATSHQFKTTKQRKNKHYKRISEKIQNPPMEDKNRSILYSFQLIIFFIYTLEKT